MKFLSLRSMAILFFLWAINTWSYQRDTRLNVDIGVETSRLPLWENAVLNLPIALLEWAGIVIFSKSICWIIGLVQRPHEDPPGHGQ